MVMLDFSPIDEDRADRLVSEYNDRLEALLDQAQKQRQFVEEYVQSRRVTLDSESVVIYAKAQRRHYSTLLKELSQDLKNSTGNMFRDQVSGVRRCIAQVQLQIDLIGAAPIDQETKTDE